MANEHADPSSERSPDAASADLTAVMEAVRELPSRFMLDPDTYRGDGAALGFEGIDYYFLGRCGPLGDVPAAVAAAAMVFFEPGMVAAAWLRGAAVGPPVAAGAAFGRTLATWADAHLPPAVDHGRLAALLGRVVDGACSAAAPLFAAWRAMPEPDSDPALALHRANCLRELQGGLHGAAVVAAGLTPAQAVAVRSPQMAVMFGWPDAAADAGAEARWRQAQRATEAAMAQALGVLGHAERSELAALLGAASAG